MNSDPTPSEDGPKPGEVPPIKRLPKPSGRTLEDQIKTRPRNDGTQGVTARELAGTVHMAHETIELAIQYPERLSLANIFDLAPLLRITPEQLIADVFHQLMIRQQLGLLRTPRQLRALRKRRVATPPASDTGLA